MNWFVPLFLFISSLSFSTKSPLDGVEWVPTKVREGVSLYRGKVNGSDVVAFKGSGHVDTPPWKLAAILLDAKRAPEWVDSLGSSKILRRLSPTSFIEYNHIETPFVMKDRDFVSFVQIELDMTERSMALRYHPTDDALVPQTHHIRGEIVHALFKIQATGNPERTLLTAEMHADPKGSVPVWIVNLFQKNWPVNTFNAIRMQVKKPDIGIAAEFKTIVLQMKAITSTL